MPKRPIYQDRLGTNIGKVKKRDAVSAGIREIKLDGNQVLVNGAKNAFLLTLYTNIHHFTKAGSEQP